MIAFQNTCFSIFIAENGDAYASFMVTSITNQTFYSSARFVALENPIRYEVLTNNLLCSWFAIGN